MIMGNSGKVYPAVLTVFSLIWVALLSGWVQAAPPVRSAYLKASNTGAADEFGTSVAIFGNLVVVGAPGEASNTRKINGAQDNDLAPNSGAAYIFVRTGYNLLSQEAYLKASDALSGDAFGKSVAISANTVVVGAPWKDTDPNNPNENSGAAYVFVRNGSTWSQQAILRGSDTAPGDYFGEAVAISGDTVVVGASGKDSQAGAAYVFVRSGTTWSQQHVLQPVNPDADDRFGYAVAVYEDTALVGAYNESSDAQGVNGASDNNNAPNSGAAYVFVRSGANWTQQAYLKASNSQAHDYFGESVNLFGDRLVVGASGEDSNARGVDGDQTNNDAQRSGAAYVFARSGTTWSQQAYFKASNTGENDLFGWSVGISGDTVVVGAWGEASRATGVDGNQGDNAAPNAGAAYKFMYNGTNWYQQAYLKASNTEQDDFFGSAVAVFEKTVVVGAYGEDSSSVGINGDQNADTAPMAGAAYFFDSPVNYFPMMFKN